MRLKQGDLPAVGQGCEPMYVDIGIYHKRQFCYCKKHSYLELNKCQACGNYFHTKRRQAKTCSDKCRKALSRKPKNKRVVIINTKAGRIEQEVMW